MRRPRSDPIQSEKPLWSERLARIPLLGWLMRARGEQLRQIYGPGVSGGVPVEVVAAPGAEGDLPGGEAYPADGPLAAWAPVSIADESLRSAVQDLLASAPDVTCVRLVDGVRGRQEWFLLSDMKQFDEIARGGRPHDAFAFFMQPQLPIRGDVDERLSGRVFQLLDAGDVLVGRVLGGRLELGSVEVFSAQDDVALERWLAMQRGKPIAAGLRPPLFEPGEHLLAVVAGENRERRAGTPPLG
jgi:hypothetical protein